jgi:hypothetical protein
LVLGDLRRLADRTVRDGIDQGVGSRKMQSLSEYFRCAAGVEAFQVMGGLSEDAGFFRFGAEIVCYGRSAAGYRSRKPDGILYDVSADVTQHGSSAQLPFDPSEVVTNFHYERYACGATRQTGTAKLVRNAYYFVRPLLPIPVRKHLQKVRLNGWRELTFPNWPVDTTVDSLMEKLMSLSIKQREGEKVPFIWFWPEGKNGCAILTHDVETQRGVDRSAWLMDMNESFGIPASFQIVPEKRYPVSEAYLDSIRRRGLEVNVQDLNHDGCLYCGRREFEGRVAKINQYRKRYGAAGFRSGVLYRNQEWFDLLDFDYDTSVPNVAHLDPQRGGCCTVMPYFIGKLVELPVTTTQDYSLFHILNDYSLQLWKQQIELILRKYGLINVITHPDYLTGPRQEETYAGLLAVLDRARQEKNVWVALPRDVSKWWRERSRMQLVQRDGEWCAEGAGSERAVVAYASLEGDVLTYSKSCPVFS